MKIGIYSIIILIQIALLVMLFSYNSLIEGYSSDAIRIFRVQTAKRFSNKPAKLPVTFLDVVSIDDRFAISQRFDTSEMVTFDSLNNIEEIMSKFIYPANCKYIFAFKGIDSLASKVTFANVMRGTPVIPVSYDLTNKDAVQRLYQDFHTTYILKKNIQQQQGLKIVSNMNEIVSTIQKDPHYVVCQELLKDPMLIANRKINIRIYMLVVIRDGTASFYIYKDGFIYYAPKEWDANSVKDEVHITTGYLKDRSIYKSNPLTYQDLLKFLPTNMSALLHQSIIGAIGIVKSRYSPLLLESNRNEKSTVCFSIFGVDVAPSKHGDVKIMEINKGPDLSYKDERDKIVKQGLTTGLLNVACFKDETSFIKMI